MPRTKQQRPRHILEENKNGEQPVDSEMTSDVLPSSADTSPDGAYTTDSGISEGYSHYPSEEVSDSAASVKSDNDRGTSMRDDTVTSDKYSRCSSYDNIHSSEIRHYDSSLKSRSNDGTEENSVLAPFVNVQSAASKTSLATENEFSENSRYMDLLKSMIAQNMTHNDKTNSHATSCAPGVMENTALPIYGHNQWSGALQNAMMNPLHILTKLIQDSIKTGEEKQRNEVKNGTQDSNNQKIPSVQSSLEFIGNQLLLGNAKSAQNLSFSENSIKDCDIPRKREIGNTSTASSEKEKNKDLKDRVFRPFLPLKVENMLEKFTTSDQENRAKSYSTSNTSRNCEDDKNLEIAAPKLLGSGDIKQPLTAHFPTLCKGAVCAVNPVTESVHSGITRPPSSDVQRHALKPDTALLNNETDGSDVLERQRKSPYANIGVSQNVPLQNRYGDRYDRDRRIRSPNKMLSSYPYPTITTGHHQPFSLPLARINDFPTVPVPPYYNPWSIMYPPYPHAMDTFCPNPFLPQFGSEALRMASNTLPKSPTLIPQADSSPNSEYHSTKKAFPRSKSQSTNPIDSLHAAIVREAKEMNKGMDPENMYIECPICHKRIKRLYHFQRHMRIHSGEKSHTCPFCPYKSVRKDNLKSHMKTHEKSKYDGSRRAQSRRENSTASNVTMKTDFLLSPESAKRRLSPLSPPSAPSSLPFLKFSPPNKPIEPSSSPSYVQQRKSPFAVNQIDRNRDDINRQSLNFPMLPTAGYYSENKLGIPYGPYPGITPFLPFAPHERRSNIEPSACITEIIDENSRSPKSRKSSYEEKTSPKNDEVVEEKQSVKRRSASPCEMDAKRPKKISVENGEELLLGNSNNSNNLEVEPLGIFSPEVREAIRHQNATTLRAWEQPSPEKREDKLSRMTGLPTEIHKGIAIKPDLLRAQNGEHSRIHQLTQGLGMPRFRSPGQDIENGTQKRDVYEKQSVVTDLTQGDQPQRANSVASSASTNSNTMVIDEDSRITHPPKSECVRQIEGKFLSFIDMRSKQIASEERRMSSGRASSSSLESTASRNDMKDDNTPFKDTVKSDAVNANTWISVPRESKCRLCDFVAPNNSTLQEHMSTHKEDGQYKCPQCEYHGKNLSKLIEHIRIHTGERPFQCDQCSYAAKRKDNLAQHKSVKHDKNRFKGATRVLKLSTQQDHKHDTLPKAPSMLPHSEYASILLGQSPFCMQDMAYFKGVNTRETGRFSYFPGEWFAKLRELPFNGHKPFSDLIAEKSSVKFGQNFLNVASGARTPSRASLSSSTTI